LFSRSFHVGRREAGAIVISVRASGRWRKSYGDRKGKLQIKTERDTDTEQQREEEGISQDSAPSLLPSPFLLS
jgi:hypothetical protein